MNRFQNVVSDSNRNEGPQSIRSDDTSDATHPTSPVTRGCLRRTKPATPGKYVGEANAAVILEVAKAIGAYLELSDVLGALITTLKPIVDVCAVGIVVRDGEYAKLHSSCTEGAQPDHHDSVQRLMERYASDLDIEPLRTRIPINDHHFSVIMSSREPYVCADVETQRRFLTDDVFLKSGIRSYVALPLTKQGELIGVVDFLSVKCRRFTTEEVTLLRDVSHMAQVEPGAGKWKTWAIPSGDVLRLAAPPDSQVTAREWQWVKGCISQRDQATLAAIAYWDAGSRGYRWMQLARQFHRPNGQWSGAGDSRSAIVF